MSNIKIEITAAGWTPIVIPNGPSVSSYSLWTEDGTYWEYATDAEGTDNIKVTASGTDCLQISVSPKFMPSGTIGYAKGSTTVNLVGIPVR